MIVAAFILFYVTCRRLCILGLYRRYKDLLLLDRLLRVDLIVQWVSNVRPPVYTSVRPQQVSSISMTFGV